MSELLTIIVDARTAQEAQAAVVKWVRAHPQIRLRTITRVRPAEGEDQWAVELAYVTVEPGLGLCRLSTLFPQIERVPLWEEWTPPEVRGHPGGDHVERPRYSTVSSQPNTGSAPMTLSVRTIYPRDPACMTVAERDAWAEANRSLKGNRATSPCHDCSGAFAVGMRAEGRCDGHYPDEAVERPGLVRRPNGYWGFASEEQRIAARRASWRESGARRRVVPA